MPRGVQWPQEEVDLLKKLIDAGLSTPEIQECLPGRTRASIHQQMRKQGWFIKGRNPEPNWDAVNKYLNIVEG